MGKDVFCLSRVWNKEKIIWRLRIFLYPMLIIDEKHLYFFTELKTYHFSYSIYKHDAMDIADPSSLQDTYDLCNRPHSPQCLCGSVVEHQNTQSKGMRFDSS